MPGNIRTGLNPAGTVTTQQVAANVVDAVRRGRPYVFTDDDGFTRHDGFTDVEARLTAIIRARGDVIT